MPQWGANIDQRLFQPLTPKKLSPDRVTCDPRHLECFVEAGHGSHVDLSQDDTVAMTFDAQLLQIGADDGERSDLWNTGERCPKLAQRGSLILRVKIAVENKFGQEFGLVAGWIEMQSGPFYDRVDNSLTAVAD